MTAGIRINNDWGTTQIDENFRNLCVIAQGSGSIPSSGRADITFNGATTPLIAVRSTNSSKIYVVWGTVTNGTYAGHISGAVGAGFAWYAFDVPANNTPLSDAGLLVWDAAGNLVFDSARKQLCIVDVFSGTTTATTSKSYPSGRTYAAIPMKQAVYAQNVTTPAGGGYYTYHTETTVEAWTMLGSTLSLSGTTFSGEESMPIMVVPRPVINSLSWSFAIVDVTNY